MPAALLATILFIVGIFSHRVLPAWPVAWLILIALLLGVGIWRRRFAISSILIAIALLLCGGVSGRSWRRFITARSDRIVRHRNARDLRSSN